jgi:response regulator of citrate/malate metabolism
VRSGRFGIVFVDYNMSEGLDMLNEIRRPHEEVTVVMITSSLESARPPGDRGGCLRVLKKPFYSADIDAILERYYELNG